ncbi:MAG TPA: hypothetical protein VHX38_18775 [Pseudonocardiaceae bacterium]|jgi:hypothetical protein|nr:hypothetical protein [Pseudonocardiaceae bacterium]
MSSPRVRIELGQHPAGNHIWVDDVDIANRVLAVHIEARAGRVPSVSVELVADEVLVDGELVEAIQPVLVRREETP